MGGLKNDFAVKEKGRRIEGFMGSGFRVKGVGLRF